MSSIATFTNISTSRGQIVVTCLCLGSWFGFRMCGIPLLPYGLLLPVLLIASMTDLADRRIPNWLTYSASALAIITASVASLAVTYFDAGPIDGVLLKESLAGFAASFGVMLLLYCTFGVGAGDVKLAGVVGACVGVQTGLMVILWAHLIGGIVMLLFIMYRVGPMWIARHILCRLLPAYVMTPFDDHSQTFQYPVPMAVFFAVGTILALTEVPLI